MPDFMPLSTLPYDAVILNLDWNISTIYISNVGIKVLELLWL